MGNKLHAANRTIHQLEKGQGKMALTKAITTDNGLSAASAYARVVSYKIDRENKLVSVGFGIYADSDKADSDSKAVIQRLNVKYQPAATYDDDYTGPTLQSLRQSATPIKDVYDHQKTLDAWDGWADA